MRRGQTVSIWKACIAIEGGVFNLGDNFISETEAAKVYNRIAQKMRKARALKKVAQSVILQNLIDGTELPPTVHVKVIYILIPYMMK